jgi:ferredoxin
MLDMAATLTARGVTPDRVKSEIFGPSDALTPGIVGGTSPRAPHPPDGEQGSGEPVVFSRSNVSAPWNPALRTLLEFAEACDVPVRWACRTGVCHTCETGLIGGAVAYDPTPLEPPAAGTVLICCAAPRGEVMLDL